MQTPEWNTTSWAYFKHWITRNLGWFSPILKTNHIPRSMSDILSSQILSDKSKRSQYDQYGYVDENESQRGDNMFRGFQFPGGGSYSFKFSSGGGQRSKPSRVTLGKLQSQILPESYSKPFLLLLTGDWCFSCMRVESLWDQIKTDLESAGRMIHPSYRYWLDYWFTSKNIFWLDSAHLSSCLTN